MRIIPVIDLLEGTVVHAKQGQRQHYQPIVSALTASSKPLDIVKAFMEIYPFETLYIADLNAIQNIVSPHKNHLAVITNIQQAFPELNIWLDAGIRNTQDAKQWQSLNHSFVLGTESIESLDEYERMSATMSNKLVLSLDFMPSGYTGLETFIQSSQHWPKDVIVMALNHVGMQQGIAKTTLQQIAQLPHQHRIYAAGGVRNLADITQLKALQVQGALIATALHTKQLDTEALEKLSHA